MVVVMLKGGFEGYQAGDVVRVRGSVGADLVRDGVAAPAPDREAEAVEAGTPAPEHRAPPPPDPAPARRPAWLEAALGYVRISAEPDTKPADAAQAPAPATPPGARGRRPWRRS